MKTPSILTAVELTLTDQQGRVVKKRRANLTDAQVAAFVDAGAQISEEVKDSISAALARHRQQAS